MSPFPPKPSNPGNHHSTLCFCEKQLFKILYNMWYSICFSLSYFTWCSTLKVHLYCHKCYVLFIIRAPLVAQTGKNLLQCRRPWFDPWVRTIPWRRKWTLSYFHPCSTGPSSVSMYQTYLSTHPHTYSPFCPVISLIIDVSSKDKVYS